MTVCITWSGHLLQTVGVEAEATNQQLTDLIDIIEPTVGPSAHVVHGICMCLILMRCNISRAFIGFRYLR